MKKLLSFILLFIWAVSLFAIPANRKPFVVKQSDGTMLSVVLKGDEAMSFYTTLDGKYLVKESNGDFCYATFSSEGRFVSTGVIAHDKEKRNNVENELLSGMDYDAMRISVSNTHKARSAKYRGTAATRAASSSVITKGEVLVPVLLVEYKDVKFTYTKADIEKILNEPGYKFKFTPANIESCGSARDYFIAQSDSQFMPKFVVTDIVTLPNKMEYYGGNDSSGNDMRPQEMIRHGIREADAAFDFSQFDNNKDREVEFVFCIYAGYSEAYQASANTIWPHMWDLVSNGSKEKADGVYLNTYACSSELHLNEKAEAKYGKWLAGIGSICHEFSHCLGLYDVYDVSGTSGNFCMNEWDLMDYGNFVGEGYIPVGYNSFQKDACGWKKLVELDKKGKYSMLPQSQGGVGYKIVNDANPNEYFILENRKREGWDQELVADGMMIIHVDYNKSAWEDNAVNTVKGHPRFQIVAADNELLLFSNADDSEHYFDNLAGDLWPGKNNNTEFTDTSLPAAKLFTGGKLNKPVTNIKYENYVASFTFMGGVDTPVAMPATDITENSFVANWSSVDDVTGYVVELYEVEYTDGENGDVSTLVNEDFLKCTKSNYEIKESEIDTYISAGWTGNRIYSENGILRIGTASNVGSLTTPKLNATGDVSISLKVNKYNSKDSGFEFIVDVLDASGEEIASEVVTTAGDVNLSAYVDGDFSVRFSTGASTEKKRVLVDDIVISVAMPYKKVLLGEVATTENHFKFDELESEEYLYRVKAIDGSDESSYSEYVKVVLASTAINDIRFDDENVVVYTVTGIKVYEGKFNAFKGMPSGIYIVKGSAGTAKIKIE